MLDLILNDCRDAVCGWNEQLCCLVI